MGAMQRIIRDLEEEEARKKKRWEEGLKKMEEAIKKWEEERGKKEEEAIKKREEGRRKEEEGSAGSWWDEHRACFKHRYRLWLVYLDKAMMIAVVLIVVLVMAILRMGKELQDST